jgi:hypothetical protein
MNMRAETATVFWLKLVISDFQWVPMVVVKSEYIPRPHGFPASMETVPHLGIKVLLSVEAAFAGWVSTTGTVSSAFVDIFSSSCWQKERRRDENYASDGIMRSDQKLSKSRGLIRLLASHNLRLGNSTTSSSKTGLRYIRNWNTGLLYST